MSHVGIEVIDGVFSTGEEIIECLNSLGGWEGSKVGENPHESGVRTSSSMFLPLLSFENPPVIHEFARAVWQCMDNYSTIYAVPFYAYEPITFNRYEPGQHFAAHPDYFKGSDRCVSAVAYLNTVERGGTTHFTYLDFTVEAVAGRVVIFPSNYLFRHSGTAPEDAVKYSAAFWARG